ncbi:MAG: slipin family protein [Chloroflexota bacterium]|jgi:regulator of protease activity HflC (stomatin/prohibitin superfamily)|nr:slipin family protein [Chloroflexota bacterium]
MFENFAGTTVVVLCLVGGGLILILLLLTRVVKVIPEYERGVVFTFGKFSGIRKPGLTFLIPIVQIMQRVDMRLATAEVPRQEVMTKDNIPMLVNAVVYFKVIDPEAVIIKIEDYIFAIRQYTQAALRDVIGNNEMDTVLMERLQIAEAIREIVDTETSDWGVDIESIKIQELELPAEMKRAMARQAEAERERRATIIASQGELEASKNLKAAADELASSPGALHLRTLQTIRDIASDPSEKIVLFMPSNMANLVDVFTGKKEK